MGALYSTENAAMLRRMLSVVPQAGGRQVPVSRHLPLILIKYR
jgi:hypothetical protein